MKNGKIRSAITLLIVYLVIIAAAAACMLLMVSEFTQRFGLSVLFVFIAYTLMFAMIAVASLGNRQNLMQNIAMVVIGIVFLIITTVVTLVLNFIQCAMRPFLAVEIIVLAIGVVVLLVAFNAKSHMDQ